MNLKSSLALAAALMMTGAAFAADTLAPNAASTPQATPSVTGAGLAQSQTDAVSKDATTTSTTTQESTTGTTDTQATGSANAKDPSKASPAVETSAAGTASQTSSSPNHVEKLFHMFQQDKQQSQAGATTPEAKPGDSSTSNPAAKTAQ